MRNFAFVLAMIWAAVATAQDLSSADMRVPTDAEREALLATATHNSAFNTFVQFARDPAEDSDISFIAMDDFGQGPQGYFRDIFAAGVTFHDGPDDGDTWTAFVQTPQGTRGFQTIEFFTTHPVTGEPNCFVNQTTGARQCRVTAVFIVWNTPSQCAPVGTWNWSFLYNNSQFSAQTHTLLPQLPVGSVISWNQGDFSSLPEHAYDGICSGDDGSVTDSSGRSISEPCPAPIVAPQRPLKISERGCLMTALVDVLNYHGVATDPQDYNDLARAILGTEAQGYNFSGLLKYTFAEKLASDQGITFQYLPDEPTDLVVDPALASDRARMDALVCRNGPQILKTKAPTPANPNVTTHYQVLLGRELEVSGQEVAFITNNPAGGGLERHAVVTPTFGGRYFSGEIVNVGILGGSLVLSLWSPAAIVLTDARGRQAGQLPGGQTLRGIPHSQYDDAAGLGDGEAGTAEGTSGKQIEIYGPADAPYLLQVIGTATGTYRLDIEGTSSDHTGQRKTFRDVPTAPGVVHEYSIDFTSAPGSTLTTLGGFDGGGQRPSDVNKFLSYVTPTASRNALPAGTTQITVTVAYGPTTIPSSFTAVFDGVDVRSNFHPAPGTFETVSLPATTGSHTLTLSVQGTLPNGRSPTDTDRLVFLVP